VSSQEDAQKVLDRLTAGEDFVAIAAEMSLDTNTKNKGGEMDWMPRAALEPAAGDAVFVLEVGQRTQPIWSDKTNTYYIYEVMEKSPSMEVTDSQRTLIENQSYTNWQDEISKQTPVVRSYIINNTSFDMDMINHLREIAKSEGSGVEQTGQ